MAAYRRRSCSRKESKSRFIFRSMSGAYASMISSWMRTPEVKDRSSYRERTGKVIRDCSLPQWGSTPAPGLVTPPVGLKGLLRESEQEADRMARDRTKQEANQT